MTLADGSYWVYHSDNLGQVISGRRFWADGTPVAGQQFEYGFDDIGNRKTTGGRESADSTYTVNDLNQYTQRTVAGKIDVFGIANPTADVTVGVTGGTAYTAARHGEYYHHTLTAGNNVYPEIEVKSLYGATDSQAGKVFNPPATEPYTHDTDGNLTQDGRWVYVWDGENRLIEMRRDATTPTGAQKKLTFEYDWQGRRIRKTVYQGDGSQTPTWTEQSDTVFLYDGWNLIAELDANAGNTPIRTYVCGNDLSGSMQGAGGVGGLLKIVNHGDSTQHFVAYDGNGNVMGLVDDRDGSVSARYEYGPFGEPLRASGIMAANPFRFSTKYCDAETGLYYYGYRLYDPPTGRWLYRDPIGERGFTMFLSVALQTPNRRPSEPGDYVFVMNEAAGHSDSLGLRTKRTVPDEIDKLAIGACGVAVYLTKQCGSVEFCGQICDCGDSPGPRYAITGPHKGIRPTQHDRFQGIGGWCDPNGAPCPDGCQPIAFYHSHPPVFRSRYFSEQDADVLNKFFSEWERAYVCSGSKGQIKSLRCLDKRHSWYDDYRIPLP